MPPPLQALHGPQKEAYLCGFLLALEALTEGVRDMAGRAGALLLEDFARSERWDLSRLPDPSHWRQHLGDQLGALAEHYSWLGKPGSQQALNADPRSGMPWAFDLVELQRSKTEAASALAKLPTFEALQSRYRELLLLDTTPDDQVLPQVRALCQQARHRDYLQRLSEAPLIDWRSQAENIQFSRLKTLGGESLWLLGVIRFFPEQSTFSLATVALWQDIREEVLGGPGPLPAELRNALRFSWDTAPVTLIERIDRAFGSLHPVHASIAQLGPYERAGAPVARALLPPNALPEDPSRGVLRLNIQYTLAPNHEEQDGELRQKTYPRPWIDEFVTCPVGHASALAHAVLGTQLIVLEH